jgi:hypothetical protein
MIAQGELFTQLAGGHYFLHPILHNEQLRCEQALQDLAYNLWDSLQSIKVDRLQFPTEHHTHGQSSESVLHNIFLADTSSLPISRKNERSIPTSEHAPPEDLTLTNVPRLKPLSSSATDPGDLSPQLTSSSPTLRHCYGKDTEDLVRLSMGSLNQSQLDTISNLHQLNSKEGFVEQLGKVFLDEAHFCLHVWRKSDYSLWNSSLPDGACGWYTIANLHRRAQALSLLNFADPVECDTGVHILQEIACNSTLDNSLRTKLLNTCRWISTGRLSPFNAQDQLSSVDFVPTNRDISTAIFLTPPYIDSPRMHDAEWLLLYHHTASSQDLATITLSELMQLRAGNFAQLVDHHFWPLPAPQH